MVTYFYDELGRVVLIDFGVSELSEAEKADPNKIQLEEEYKVPEKEGYTYDLYVEDGQLKHRYIEIQKSDIEKENERLKEQLQKQSKEITQNQMAIVQIYELLSGGTGGTESESHS